MLSITRKWYLIAYVLSYDFIIFVGTTGMPKLMNAYTYASIAKASKLANQNIHDIMGKNVRLESSNKKALHKARINQILAREARIARYDDGLIVI